MDWAAILILVVVIIYMFRVISFFIRVLPRVKKQYVYLINKNRFWLVLILALNIVIVPYIWLVYKFYISLPHWGVLIFGFIIFILAFLAWNLNLIPALFELWYKSDNSINNIESRHYSSKDFYLGIFWALIFLFFVWSFVFYPGILPSRLYNFLANWNRY